MAIDLEAIRKKLQSMNSTGDKKSLSSVQLWKPAPGEYRIRALPWPKAQPGEPILERSFYFIGKQKGFLAPSQFGKEDPIEKMRRSLFETKSPEDKALAKNLFPKVYGYLPIVDRANEAAGIQLWKFPKTINTRLLGFFVDEDCGDFLDPVEGRDLKVVITQVKGKTYTDTVVDFRPKSTPLHNDEETRKKWLSSVPELDDLHPYAFKTTEQINSIVNAWLSGDEESAEETTRGEASEDSVEKVAKELDDSKEQKAAAKPKQQPAPVAKKKPVVDDDDDDLPVASGGSSSSDDLDAAFAELTQD